MIWRNAQWHVAMRANVKEMLNAQMKKCSMLAFEILHPTARSWLRHPTHLFVCPPEAHLTHDEQIMLCHFARTVITMPFDKWEKQQLTLSNPWMSWIIPHSHPSSNWLGRCMLLYPSSVGVPPLVKERLLKFISAIIHDDPVMLLWLKFNCSVIRVMSAMMTIPVGLLVQHLYQ